MFIEPGNKELLKWAHEAMKTYVPSDATIKAISTLPIFSANDEDVVYCQPTPRAYIRLVNMLDRG